jgi:predicted nucleic acid-binding Zn ribbon protein
MERAGRLIRKMNLPPQLADAETRVRAAWPAAAGRVIASHTQARALVRSTLIVEVEDHVWQNQLSTLRHFLLRNLAKELDEALVTEIDFRPMRFSQATPRRAPQRAASARNDGTAGIGDPVLGLLYEKSRRSAG